MEIVTLFVLWYNENRDKHQKPDFEDIKDFSEYVKLFEEIIKTLTIKDIESDITLNVYSCFGGMKIGEVKISEMKKCVDAQEDRGYGIDYVFENKTNGE